MSSADVRFPPVLAARRLEFLAGDVARAERSLASIASPEQAVEIAHALAALLESVAPVSARLATRTRQYGRNAADADEARRLRELAAGLDDVTAVVLDLAANVRDE